MLLLKFYKYVSMMYIQYVHDLVLNENSGGGDIGRAESSRTRS